MQVVVRKWNAPDEVLEPVADEDEVRALRHQLSGLRFLAALNTALGSALHVLPLLLRPPHTSLPAPRPAQVERFTHAVRGFQLDAFLAPYDLSSHNRWRQLSGHISAAVVDALQPLGGNINILAESDPALLRPATAAEEALYAQLQKGRDAQAAAKAAAADEGAAGEQQGAEAEGMQAEQQLGAGTVPVAATAQQQQQEERWTAAPHAGRCYYTPLPRLVKRGGLTPQELTGERPAGCAS